MSEETRFEIDGDFLVIFHEDEYDRGEVIIAEDGALTVNGQGVETDSRCRRLLRRLYREAARLEDRTERLVENADGLDAEAVAYATAALRSLGADQELGTDQELGGQDLSVELEEDEELNERTEKLKELAEELRDRVAELAELDWFLDL